MTKQDEYDKHVRFVQAELLSFRIDADAQGWSSSERVEEAESKAHAIVLWVSSKPVDRWHDWRVWSFGYWVGGLVTLSMVWLVSNI